MSGDLGFSVQPKANLTFSKCLDMNLQDHITVISKIAEVAGKEYAIEQVILKNHLLSFHTNDKIRICLFATSQLIYTYNYRHTANCFQ